VARGLAVGVPLVLLFGGLFVATDSVFKGYVTGALPTLGTPVRFALVLTGSWLSAGLLRDLVAPREDTCVLSPTALARELPRARLGATEVLIARTGVCGGSCGDTSCCSGCSPARSSACCSS
jgi:hypothetical protein